MPRGAIVKARLCGRADRASSHEEGQRSHSMFDLAVAEPDQPWRALPGIAVPSDSQ